MSLGRLIVFSPDVDAGSGGKLEMPDAAGFARVSVVLLQALSTKGMTARNRHRLV